jgi:uncharacterized MAPEG superfamily protein
MDGATDCAARPSGECGAAQCVRGICALAAAVFMAQLAGVDEIRIAWLAVAFVVFRGLHGIVYTLGMPHSLRTLVWSFALACVLALMAMAALQLGPMA